MVTHRRTIAPLLALLLAGAAAGAGESPEAPNIVPPPPPEALTRGEPIEPTVTIVSRPWAEIREYSIHGRLYAVRIDPDWGPPYYLLDDDGDGSLESRHPTSLDAPNIHQWEFLRW